MPGKSDGERWSVPAAMLLAGFYLVTSIFIAAHRLLWFDEIVTTLFGKLPNLQTIWKAAGHVDAWGMPAPYYFLVHAFLEVFGPAEISARLPSALGMTAGLLITFYCVRRLTDGLHGLIALTFLTCTFLPHYGIEARSYGLYFMLAAISFRLWVHGKEAGKLAALEFFVVFFAGFMMHPYFVLCLVPYAVSEFFSRRGGVGYPRIIGAGAGIFFAAAILSTHLLAAGSSRTPFPGQHPSTSALMNALNDIYPGALLLLVLATLWIALVSSNSAGSTVAAMNLAERTGWFFLLVPLAGFALAELVTKAFDSRYFIGMVPGIAAAVACVLWRYFRNTRLVAAGIFSLLACCGLVRQIVVLRHPESIDPYGQQTKTKQVLHLEESLQKDGKQFIVLSGTLLYMEAQYYARSPEKYRFLESNDPTYRLPVYFSEYYPLKIWQFRDLKDHARETAFIFPESATIEALKQAGLVPTFRFSEPIRVAYFQ